MVIDVDGGKDGGAEDVNALLVLLLLLWLLWRALLCGDMGGGGPADCCCWLGMAIDVIGNASRGDSRDAADAGTYGSADTFDTRCAALSGSSSTAKLRRVCKRAPPPPPRRSDAEHSRCANAVGLVANQR